MHEPSRAALRKFGLSVGGVFLLLGAVSWWRGGSAWPFLTGAGSPLVALGLVAPGLLVPVERVWMRAAEVLGRINTRIILSVLFFVVFTPVGVLRRWRHDPLNRRMHDGRPTNWTPRERKPVDPARYRHQF